MYLRIKKFCKEGMQWTVVTYPVFVLCVVRAVVGLWLLNYHNNNYSAPVHQREVKGGRKQNVFQF